MMSDDGPFQNDEDLLKAAGDVLSACAFLSVKDRQLVLQLAWMLLAQQTRSEALATCGGFEREQARQLDQLEKISVMVRRDTPDLESQRLLREGDEERARQYLESLQRAEH
jgi:hypothetical protein